MEPISWKDLAARLETTVQSLHRWRSMDGAPTEPDLEAWQAFKARQNLGRDRLTPDLGALKAELLREQIKRERGRNAREASQQQVLSHVPVDPFAWSFAMIASGKHSRTGANQFCRQP